MISARAIATIEQLFEQSIKETLSADLVLTRAQNLAELPRTGSGNAPVTNQVVAMLIASYEFRIIALFDFDTGRPPCGNESLSSTAVRREEKTDLPPDHMGEVANMICGTVNRRLQTVFRHTGLSTPFGLETGCTRYVEQLKPDHAQRYIATGLDEPQFRLTLCVCVNAETTLDFHLTSEVVEETTSGELELF